MSQSTINLPTLPAGSTSATGLIGMFPLPETFDVGETFTNPYGTGATFRWTRDDPTDPSAVWSISGTVSVLGDTGAAAGWTNYTASGPVFEIVFPPTGSGSAAGASENGELVIELTDASGVPLPWIYVYGAVASTPPSGGWYRRLNTETNHAGTNNVDQYISNFIYHPTDPILAIWNNSSTVGNPSLDEKNYGYGGLQLFTINPQSGQLSSKAVGANKNAVRTGSGADISDTAYVSESADAAKDGDLFVYYTRQYDGNNHPTWTEIDLDGTNTETVSAPTSSGYVWFAHITKNKTVSAKKSSYARGTGSLNHVYDFQRYNAGDSGWQVYFVDAEGPENSSSYCLSITDPTTGKSVRFERPTSIFGSYGIALNATILNSPYYNLRAYCNSSQYEDRFITLDLDNVGATAIFPTMTSVLHNWTPTSGWSYITTSEYNFKAQTTLGNGNLLCTTTGSDVSYFTEKNVKILNPSNGVETAVPGFSFGSHTKVAVVAETANYIIVYAKGGVDSCSFSNGASIPSGHDNGSANEVDSALFYLSKSDGAVKGAALFEIKDYDGSISTARRIFCGDDDIFAIQGTTVRVLTFGEGPWGSSTRTSVDWTNPDFQHDNGARLYSIEEPIMLYKMTDDWSNFTSEENTTGTEDPPGGNTGGGSQTGTDIAAPYSLDWPDEAYEGDTITGTFQVDPSTAWLYNPIATFQVRDGNNWITTDFDTTDKYGEPDRSGHYLNGTGTIYLEQAKDTWPADATGIPANNTVEIRFKPDDQWKGKLQFHLRAVFHPTHNNPDGTFAGTTSPEALVETEYFNEPDRPAVRGDTFPDTVEEVAVGTAMTVEDPDSSGNYTWELSADHQPETWESGDPDFRTNTSTTSVTITDDEGYTAGTVAITSQSGTTVNLTFTPAQYWNGTSEVWLRVDNNTGAEVSRWRRLPVKVEAVSNAPSAPTPTSFGTFQEDTTSTLSISWTDPDIGPGQRSGNFVTQVKLSTGTTWIDLLEGELIDLGDVRVRLTAFDTVAQTAELRAEPKSNWNGSFAFDLRIKDRSDETELYSPSVSMSGTVTSSPDAPSKVVPSTMPKCKPNGVVYGSFSTFDPDADDTAWIFEVATQESGPWTSSSISVPGATIEVVDRDLSDRRTRIKATADQDATGSYTFWIRVTDNTGRQSPPTLVKGYITNNQPGVWLQRLNRDTSPATVELLCPLTTVTDLSVTSALDGPGIASVTVSARELRFRAEQLSTTGPELLDAGSTEVLVTSGGKPLWCGPISRYNIDAADPNGVVTIEASGLASYLSGSPLGPARTDPLGTTDFELADQSSIVVDLFNSGDFADSHAFTDGTIPTGTSSVISIENSLTIAEAIKQLQNEPNSAEVYIDPDRTFRATAVRGVDRRPSVKFFSSSALSVDREKKSDQTVTAAIVTSSLGFSGYHEDTDGVKKYGRLTRTVQADGLTSNLACNALAMEIVERAKSTAETVSLTTYVMDAAPFSATDIEPGDLIGVNLEDPNLGKLAGDFRVISSTVAWGQDTPPGSTKISLILEPAVWVDGVLQGSRSSHVAEFYSMAYEALYR